MFSHFSAVCVCDPKNYLPFPNTRAAKTVPIYSNTILHLHTVLLVLVFIASCNNTFIVPNLLHYPATALAIYYSHNVSVCKNVHLFQTDTFSRQGERLEFLQNQSLQLCVYEFCNERCVSSFFIWKADILKHDCAETICNRFVTDELGLRLQEKSERI